MVYATWTCPYVSLCSIMSTGDWDLFPWYWRGRRLVELTEGCYNKEDSNGLPVWIKQLPCPWDVHYLFSIKSLLSNNMWTFAGIYVRPATVETIVAKQYVAMPTLGYSKPNKRLDTWNCRHTLSAGSWYRKIILIVLKRNHALITVNLGADNTSDCQKNPHKVSKRTPQDTNV